MTRGRSVEMHSNFIVAVIRLNLIITFKSYRRLLLLVIRVFSITPALVLSAGLLFSVPPDTGQVYGQQNLTGNTTSMQQQGQQNQTTGIGSASEIENLTAGNTPMVGNETSGTVREAIAEPGEFLGNITEKITTSEPVETIVNGTSDVLGIR